MAGVGEAVADDVVGVPPRTRGRMGAALIAVRPGEWIKNLFVLAPLLFGARIDQAGAVGDALLATVAFCAMASAGYLVNDSLDAEYDRRHPVKKGRPIASGELPVPVAMAMAACLAVAGTALAGAAGLPVAGVVAGYGILTVAYSTRLKHLVILDVMAISGCFLLRVYGGALAVDLEASEWLLFCTGMLALLLALTKRRQEVRREIEEPFSTRLVLEHYPVAFLDQTVSLVTAGTLLSYGIYAINSPLVGGRMLATVPVVLYGLLRYLYLIYGREDERDTAAIVRSDPGIIGALVAWVAVVALLLYV